LYIFIEVSEELTILFFSEDDGSRFIRNVGERVTVLSYPEDRGSRCLRTLVPI
jgi:hypothetical protein